MTTETIDETIATWTREPDKARGAPTVTARSEGSQAVIQAGPFTWRADLPPALGGANQAPSPTALLLGALAGCAVVFVRDTLAPQLKSRSPPWRRPWDARPTPGGCWAWTAPSPTWPVTMEVSVTSPDGEAAVAEVARVWLERCPIYLALMKPVDIDVRFRAA